VIDVILISWKQNFSHFNIGMANTNAHVVADLSSKEYFPITIALYLIVVITSILVTDLGKVSISSHY